MNAKFFPNFHTIFAVLPFAGFSFAIIISHMPRKS